MKILFTTHPAVGHLHPMVPIALAAATHGHEVVFATSRRFADRVQALGFRVIVAGYDWLESEAAESFPELSTLGFEEVNRFFMQELFTDRLARPMVRDLVRFIHEERPQVVVRETWEFAGALAAEICGIPHAVISAGLNFRIWQHMVRDTLAERRYEYGLAPDPTLGFLERHLVLDHVPNALHFPDPALPDTRQPVGRALFDGKGPSSDELPRTFDAPIVYVTAGTVFNRIPGYFETIIEALADAQVRVVITTGRPKEETAAFTTSSLPKNVTVARYIPQSQILQQSAVMISHGGFNTILGAVQQGVPVITVPIAADQGQNGARMAATGCGICLPFHPGVAGFPCCAELKSAPPFSIESVRESVRRILLERSFAVNSRALQLQALAMPGPHAAVRALEQVVAARTNPLQSVGGQQLTGTASV
ncbi:MAG: glycosyltransferase [Polyangiaceae bacterium]